MGILSILGSLWGHSATASPPPKMNMKFMHECSCPRLPKDAETSRCPWVVENLAANSALKVYQVDDLLSMLKSLLKVHAQCCPQRLKVNTA